MNATCYFGVLYQLANVMMNLTFNFSNVKVFGSLRVMLKRINSLWNALSLPSQESEKGRNLTTTEELRTNTLLLGRIQDFSKLSTNVVKIYICSNNSGDVAFSYLMTL